MASAFRDRAPNLQGPPRLGVHGLSELDLACVRAAVEVASATPRGVRRPSFLTSLADDRAPEPLRSRACRVNRGRRAARRSTSAPWCHRGDTDSLKAVQTLGGTLVNQRTRIVLEEGASAEIWEQSLSASEELDGVFNITTDLVVGQATRLRYVSGQALSERSWMFGSQRARSPATRRSTGSRSGSAHGPGTSGWRLGSEARAPTLA